ncbi:MAG: RidA family protein [Sediminimonas qiaohouensis]|uniref:RidA family protein n=1 Tax=Sediminimonas qiaohouensis TaxID=552061 RepID=A0A7C9HA10_9RHOB|nr:RidA family protein [Sediminimonas qiaohouensis]MTJ03105.1 RidA family protein [Sediminimonas qiaohouensis]
MENRIIHPEGWAPAKGYANGVLASDGTLYIGGQIGWDAQQVFASDGFIGQMEQALINIRTILEAADGQPEDLVRLTWYVTSKQEYLDNQRAIGEVYRRVLGRHFPAMTMVVVADLIEDRAVVEIEATAVLKRRS